MANVYAASSRLLTSIAHLRGGHSFADQVSVPPPTLAHRRSWVLSASIHLRLGVGWNRVVPATCKGPDLAETLDGPPLVVFPGVF